MRLTQRNLDGFRVILSRVQADIKAGKRPSAAHVVKLAVGCQMLLDAADWDAVADVDVVATPHAAPGP